MKPRVIIVLTAVIIVAGIALVARPAGTSYGRTIVDASWPNCGVKTADVFATGVVGVTGGLDFHPNPCVGEEAGWFSHYAVYMNTGYPGRARGQKFKSAPRRCGAKDDLCLAYNYGYNAALYAINYAGSQNAHANLWWLDVETENNWTDNFLVNRQFLRGAETAIKQKVWFATVGIYSSPNQWNEIVGPWQNKLPAWVATGATDKNTAVQVCRARAFTGGKAWLSQYTIKFDEDLPCSNHFTRQAANEPLQSLPPLKNLVTGRS
ncbi:MAG TPA: hypothetical protein VMU97_01095 [Candidatus Dormibacteraeota bacterium]|nr:hypothetical protein [Candidatus Dormibacteraeota bacterium]